MTYSRSLINKINHIHLRILCIFYKGFWTSFKGLLAKDNSVTIPNWNLQQLAIEIFKVKMGNSPITMKEMFNFSDNNNYNLRSATHLIRPFVHTIHYRASGPLQIMEQKYWDWYHKILKKKRPFVVLKTRLRNGYQKIAHTVFVRHIFPKLDLFIFFV